jgi:type I restriction enzyme, S subunit
MLKPQLSYQWRTIKLGEYIEVIRGASPRPKGDPRFFGGNINWISIKDVNAEQGKYLTTTREFVTEAGAAKSRLLPIGSLILSNSASVCIPKILKKEGCIHDGFVSFPSLNQNFHVDYFYHLFNCMRPDVIQKNKQGVTQVNLNTDIIRDFDLPIPPLAEQKVIADKLDTLLAQVDNTKARLERIPEILKSFRQSVLAAAVSGKLTEEWRNENVLPTVSIVHNKKLPALEETDQYSVSVINWVWARFGSIVDLINGDRGKNYPNQSEYVEVGIPFINTGHIDPDGTLSDERMNYLTKEKYDILGSGKTKSNDLVYCLRGATMGKTARVHYDVGAIASSLVIVRPRPEIERDFAYYFLISPQSKKLITEFDNGSAQPNLSAKSLACYPIQLPPKVEQTEIVRRVEVLFAFADRIEQAAQAAQSRVNNLTQSILAKAFRGELTADWRAANPDLISGDNSAEALLAKIKTERATVAENKRGRKAAIND